MGISFGKIFDGVTKVSAIAGAIAGKGQDSQQGIEAPLNVEDPTRAMRSYSRKGVRSFKGIKYPDDLGGHYFFIDFFEYRYSPDKAVRSTKDSVLTINLPVPNENRQDYKVNWMASQFGMLEGTRGMGEDALNSVRESGSITQAVMNAFKNSADADLGAAAQQAAPGAARALPAIPKLAGLATPGLGDIVSAVSGSQINTNETALMRGIPTRPFTFTWKLSPRNQAEEDSLHEIIREIRSRMYPSKQAANNQDESYFFLSYPNTVQVGFTGGTKSDYYFYAMAAITDFSVDMASDGQAFFQKTGNPVTYNLSLSIQELRALTKADIQQGEDAAFFDMMDDLGF